VTNQEMEIMSYLNTNWDLSPADTPPISWANSNVVINYDANQDYLVPTIVTLATQILEVPSNCGAVRTDYSFGLNFLLVENTGMSAAKTYVDKLRDIFHKKDITTSSYTYHFSALEVTQGFSSGAHFELPGSVLFFTYST